MQNHIWCWYRTEWLLYWKKELLFLHFKLACLHWHIYRDGERWGLGPVQGGCVPASCPVTTGMDSVFNRTKMEYGRIVDDLWRKRQFNVFIQSPLLIWKRVNWISSCKRRLQPTGGDPWHLHTGAGLNSEPSRGPAHCPSYRREPICLSCPLLFPAPRTHLCNLCLIWEGKVRMMDYFRLKSVFPLLKLEKI